MKTYLRELNQALHELLSEDKSVHILGEDIIDPYGGAFKVTEGLSTKFPDQVHATPISEAGIVGVGNGLALGGLKPIVEIMFGDFITLAADQLINYAAKFSAMYQREGICPIVVRTPMGGGRGYGPTHSQSLEKLFFGIPGINIVAPSHFHPVGKILKNTVSNEGTPTLFVENKRLYQKELLLSDTDKLYIEPIGDNLYPITQVRNFDTGLADLVLITYGGAAEWVETLMTQMIDEEINLTSYIISQVKPLDLSSVYEEIKAVGKVIIVEEGTGSFGWGSEVVALLHENLWSYLKLPIRRVAAEDSVIPSSRLLERKVLPSVSRIEAVLDDMLQ